MVRQIPNILTIARLVLVPVVLKAIWDLEFRSALAWCVIAGITDALDGYLARRLDARTRVGAYLDPIADKLLLSGTYVVLGVQAIIPWWVAVVVCGRDLVILVFAAAVFATTSIRDFPPSIWGKLSTVIQIGAAVFILALDLLKPPAVLVDFALFLVVVATAWSALHYLFAGITMLRRRPAQN